MWKNDNEHDRGRRRVRGRRRRETGKRRDGKKGSQKRDENRTPHASRGVTSCIYAGGFFAALIVMIIISIATGGNAPAFVGGLALVIFFRRMDGRDHRIPGLQRTRQELYHLQDRSSMQSGDSAWISREYLSGGFCKMDEVMVRGTVRAFQRASERHFDGRDGQGAVPGLFSEDSSLSSDAG